MIFFIVLVLVSILFLGVLYSFLMMLTLKKTLKLLNRVRGLSDYILNYIENHPHHGLILPQAIKLNTLLKEQIKQVEK